MSRRRECYQSTAKREILIGVIQTASNFRPCVLGPKFQAVMEGRRGTLLKSFAGIDVFDIEIK